MRFAESDRARLEETSRRNRESKFPRLKTEPPPDSKVNRCERVGDHSVDANKKIKPSKYRNVKTVVDGITFDSKAEARYYGELKLLQAAGEVRYFLRQTPFHLPGGVTYRADFLVFYPDGREAVVDVKGVITKEFAIKKKLVEATYPVKVEVVK